jgi:hypothetical protein
VGKNFVLSGEYIWKHTHNGFDFSVLGNTAITLPIHWHNSKIPGFDLRADMPHFDGLSAFVVMSPVAALFYPPQAPEPLVDSPRVSSILFASITTKSKTKPSNNGSPVSSRPGSPSIGDSTAAS